METTKSPFISVTMWGALLGLLGTFLPKTGITLGSAETDQVAQALVAVIGFGMAVYGRWRATATISLTGK